MDKDIVDACTARLGKPRVEKRGWVGRVRYNKVVDTRINGVSAHANLINERQTLSSESTVINIHLTLTNDSA